MKKLLAISFIASLFLTAASAQSVNAKLQGVWKVVEIKTSGPNSITNSNPQPGMYIYTAKPFASFLTVSDSPRPALPTDMSKATVQELQAVYDPLLAGTGTYESAGDTLTLNLIVSKNPSLMRPGYFASYAIKLEGNTLWITPAKSSDGPAKNPRTIKVIRVE